MDFGEDQEGDGGCKADLWQDFSLTKRISPRALKGFFLAD